jgi:antirestriction protein ArdC
MNFQEIYQNVTNTIIELLEGHLEKWNKPGIGFGQDQDYARNLISGILYRNINQFLLGYFLMKKGYLKNSWITFKQTKNLIMVILNSLRVVSIGNCSAKQSQV